MNNPHSTNNMNNHIPNMNSQNTNPNHQAPNMNSQLHQHDIFNEQSSLRSPAAHRPQPPMIHRQPSRHFDAYGSLPNNGYNYDEQSLRYETNRFDRMNGSMPNGGYNYDIPQAQAQTWNPNAFSSNNNLAAPFPHAATGRRMNSQTRIGRTALPSTWMDPQQMSATNGFTGLGPSPLGMSHLRSEQYPAEPEEDLIPTAIVIKNIPFAVKKEQLVELMTQMNLPLPYAFNYHFDNGVFRGLAFANFTSPDETAQVIEHLNHYDLQGRKLRVEYKKMLPLHERERIEREKRERRGQLEEQHRPLNGNQLHNQPSISSLSSHRPTNSPSPVNPGNIIPGIDFNDGQTLHWYTQLVVFRDDPTRDSITFAPDLAPQKRRIIHTIAHSLNLGHDSHDAGNGRQVHVFRPQGISPPLPQISGIQGLDPSRRSLARAATIDFREARNNQNGPYNTLRGQQSSHLLGVPDSPNSFGGQQNLRTAKSVADLRAFTPSPVPSTGSFPPELQSNVARYQDHGRLNGTLATPTLTPTASGSGLGNGYRDDSLINGFGSMNIGPNVAPTGGSPRRLRGAFSWDQDNQQASAGPTNAGAIGSNRGFSMNYDNSSQGSGLGNPTRQPRGPGERGPPAFSRGRQNGHQTRSSDESRQQNGQHDIIPE